jgi:predicted phage terminase large subunit-like protein
VSDSLKILEHATLEMVDSALLSKDFKLFVIEAWEHIEPAPLVWNWHMAAICDHYQAVSEGRIKNLLVNVPPGTSKSLITSVFWPAWEWSWNPKIRWFFASYDQALSLRDSVKCRTLINSRWYQARWGHVFKLTGDQDAKGLYNTDKGGYRMASSVTGHGTGEHPHRIVADDPQDRKGAESETERASVRAWWKGTMSTRGVSLGASRVICAQRLHEDDLSGIILEDMEGWDHLCLPMRYEPGRMKRTSIGFLDPRTVPGELLAPRQFSGDAVTRLERELGSYGAAGQLQQRPSPAEGGIIKRNWWQFYDDIPVHFDKVLWSWDATFKDAETSDFVVGQVWGLKGINVYLLDQVRDRMDFPKTLAAVKALRSKWIKYPKLLQDPTTVCKTLIEDTANGPAIISTLRHDVAAVLPVKVKGSKEARLQAIAPLIEAGQVFLPRGQAFSESLMDEAAQFPNGAHDDQLDALSQALAHLQPGVWNPAEAQKPKPTNLYEMRAQEMEQKLKAYQKPSEDAVVPERFKFLR